MPISIIATPGKAQFRAILDSYAAKPDPDENRAHDKLRVLVVELLSAYEDRATPGSVVADDVLEEARAVARSFGHRATTAVGKGMPTP